MSPTLRTIVLFENSLLGFLVCEINLQDIKSNEVLFYEYRLDVQSINETHENGFLSNHWGNVDSWAVYFNYVHVFFKNM